MEYDHHDKAGNQSDMVKHPALMAALDSILRDFKGKEFKFADAFAGYAHNPLVEGKKWKLGIGKLLAGQLKELCKNPHTKLWYEWYLESRPKLVGGMYPGSSLIAHDICQHYKKTPKLRLWDIGPSPIADLVRVFKSTDHLIFTQPANPNDNELTTADFVFVDPPNATWKKKSGMPHWENVIKLINQKAVNSALLWMPNNISQKKHPETKDVLELTDDTKPQRDDVLAKGFDVSVVRWSDGVQTVGCQLFYKLESHVCDAVRSAIDHVVKVAGWQNKLPDDIRAVEHLQHTSSGTPAA